MSNKKQARARRARRTRARIKQLMVPRLTVFRSSRHIYAQIFSADGARVLAAASTVEKEVRSALDGSTHDAAAAAQVGRAVAEKARQAGIEAVAFDRSGYQYHGRVKALAEAAREAGLQF